MVRYASGTVLLIAFPFTDSTNVKRRPALVLLDAGDDDILVARITSQLSQTEFDVELQDWQQAGLKLASVARLHKLATLEKRLVERTLGKLTDHDFQQMKVTLQHLTEAVQCLL